MAGILNTLSAMFAAGGWGADPFQVALAQASNDDVGAAGVATGQAAGAALSDTVDTVAAAPAIAWQAAGQAVQNVEDAAARAASGAAASTWDAVAPYVAFGALALLIIEVRRAR